MKKKLLALCMIALFGITAVTGCSEKTGSSQVPGELTEFDASSDFESIVEQARGTKVSFYGWGGDDRRNEWLDTVVASSLKEKYDITLERVPMDIDQILAKLSGEKQAGGKAGSVDVIWINGENFYSAKENGLLFGPFAQNLPNYKNLVDAKDSENIYDFGYPIEGFEAPYGKAQLVLMNDKALNPETPENAKELMDYAKKYPGKVTYPAPPDFTGSAFVRNIIYDIVGHEKFADMKPDKETVREAIMPAIKYLNEIKPYLWNQGKTYPASSMLMDNMFADAEVGINMSYYPFSVALSIKDGIYPKTSRAFLFENGTIGNVSYMAIAENASNKAGSMVVINEIMSAQIQASQLDVLKTLSVLDYNRLSSEERVLFDSVDMGEGTISQEELAEKRLPEMPAKLVPLIEEIWQEEVAGK